MLVVKKQNNTHKYYKEKEKTAMAVFSYEEDTRRYISADLSS
jgi:hypothetical protein